MPAGRVLPEDMLREDPPERPAAHDDHIERLGAGMNRRVRAVPGLRKGVAHPPPHNVLGKRRALGRQHVTPPPRHRPPDETSPTMGSDPGAPLIHIEPGQFWDVVDCGSVESSASAAGMRTPWISLAMLGATALLQAAVVALSGSVALLADTLHNAADALTAAPLGSRAADRAQSAR